MARSRVSTWCLPTLHSESPRARSRGVLLLTRLHLGITIMLYLMAKGFRHPG